MSTSTDTIFISEIFGPTIQGEGALIGQPTVFVRTGGCDFRCSWCDTLYAVDKKYRKDWIPMSAGAVLEKVEKLSHGQPILITLSGGNPAMQPLDELIDAGHKKGFTFAMETQGTVLQPWFSKLDAMTLSPKPPSSKMKFDAEKLSACIKAVGSNTSLSLKIVVADERDLEWAGERRIAHPQLPIVLQPCNLSSGDAAVDPDALNAKMRWLVDEVNSRHWFNVRVLPQLHVQLWGNERGV
ncbi:MAG: 7-carboxy-7-deazaguanine synthase QueE [Pseudomonadota bacterium]